MDRSATLSFRDQLRQARDRAFRDAEAFDEIIHAVERLGSFLYEKIGDLGKYRDKLKNLAEQSALAKEIPALWRDVHVPFCLLYELVKDARNDALHQGAFARHLTEHTIELALVLEDALMSGLSSAVVGDYMVRSPVCAELWQPISFIRQQMLANSFSFLPVRNSRGTWCTVSDRAIATFLGTDPKRRKERLIRSLTHATEIELVPARCCAVSISAAEALQRMDDRPLLICRGEGSQAELLGMLTAFDLL